MAQLGFPQPGREQAEASAEEWAEGQKMEEAVERGGEYGETRATRKVERQRKIK
jgi:hypothetical protein